MSEKQKALAELIGFALSAIKDSLYSAECKQKAFEVLAKAELPVVFTSSIKVEKKPLGIIFSNQFRAIGFDSKESYHPFQVTKDSEEFIAKEEVINDRVEHPFHYTWLKDLCGIEVIDITRHMDFDLGNAIKYILRQGRKSEEGIADIDKAIEDLKKATWYINDEIKMLEQYGIESERNIKAV